jgi:hypothetical protein
VICCSREPVRIRSGTNDNARWFKYREPRPAMTDTTEPMQTDAGATVPFACPRCDRALDRIEGGNRCAGCRVNFPVLAGVPWLFAEPSAALGEWRARLNFELRRIERDRERRSEAGLRKDLAAATRVRLEAEVAALASHAQRIAALLAPLAAASPGAELASYLALRTRPPSDQGVVTYYQNLHRDWAWGEAENDASFAIVAEALAGNTPGRMLVLGSGAGRLAYDLHMRLDPAVTFALDFNPLLVLIADRIMRGERIELHEFPIAPRGDRAVLNSLCAATPLRPGFQHVLADALRPPFPPGSFDTVVTPWLIDIVPEPFPRLAARINTLLVPGGRWLNFGSLAFQDTDPALALSLPEVADVVASSGFDRPLISETRIPYMCSPASRHGRTEMVVSWSAARTGKVKRAPRHEALPDWLVRGDVPVPRSEHVATQAFATRVHAFILSLADGHRTLKDMAEVLVEQKLMHEAEAEGAVRSFFIKVYEDGLRSGRP